MRRRDYNSWGRFPRFPQTALTMPWRSDALPRSASASPVIPYGNGRSYGDVCLNRGGAVIDAGALDHFIAFDTETGVLRCESGLTLGQMLRLVVPAGWFLPVCPGTQFATLGGAIANDIHGKNHHREGTFGCHVTAFELLRSDGSRRVCTPTANASLFAATIGGLGLTGLITWAEVQLRPLVSQMVEEESYKFAHLDQFFGLSDGSDSDFEYTVAWVDCLAHGEALGRGLFARSNHADMAVKDSPKWPVKPLFTVPFCPPLSLVNRYSLRLFNGVWYGRQRERRVTRANHFAPFLFPLDRIGNWNLMYGPKGMVQYQCVLPGENGREVLRSLLRVIARSGQGSFLAVLKTFGDRQSPGMMSFPRPGVTLALDFAATPDVLQLLDRLDAMTVEAGGAVYPAKDARMSAATFRASFPQWERFATSIDPGFSSSFWRRVTGSAG